MAKPDLMNEAPFAGAPDYSVPGLRIRRTEESDGPGLIIQCAAFCSLGLIASMRGFHLSRAAEHRARSLGSCWQCGVRRRRHCASSSSAFWELGLI